MAEVKFNEHGDLVNAETGKIVASNINGQITFDSNGAEAHTLEELGCSLPPIPEDPDDKEEEEEEEDEQKEQKPKKKPGSLFNASSSRKMHFDKSPSSFDGEKTKYEVKSDSVFVIRFGLMERDGRMVPIADHEVERFPESEHHWVKFRMWTYPEQLEWHDWASQWDSQAKQKTLDSDKLNERKIKCLLLDWSFGEKEDRLKLLHCDGVLSDESYAIFMGLYPAIATTIVKMMNSVLESLF